MTEHTLIFANYTAEKTDEGLLIHDVELSRETSKADRPDFLRDLDIKTFEQFKTHYDARVDAGKVGAFILLDHEGPGVGRILNLRIEQKQLVGDLLVTNDEVIDMIERGELTERSIEWGWSKTDAKLKGLALLSGRFGEDSVGWPDLTVNVVSKEWLDTEFEINPVFKMKMSSSPILANVRPESITPTKETNMTPEDLEKLAELMAAKLSANTPAEPARDFELEVKAAAEKMNSGRDKRMAEMERSFKINTYVTQLAVEDGPYTAKSLREMFESKKTDEGMEEMFKRLSSPSDEDVKLEIERDWAGASLEDELKMEYKAYVARYNSDMDLETYCSIAQKKDHVDLSGKDANIVKGSVKL